VPAGPAGPAGPVEPSHANRKALASNMPTNRVVRWIERIVFFLFISCFCPMLAGTSILSHIMLRDVKPAFSINAF
jgi:hypothetical protein